MREYSVEQVQEHCRKDDQWIVHSNKVYDISLFLHDHPGGVEVLEEYAGKDITAAMENPDFHQHSQAAYKMLAKYQIGTISTTGGRKGESTGVANENNEFLDLKQPLIWQLLTKKSLTKEYYLEQIHIGRHLDVPARLFHNPLLERLSHTPWWVIPTIWLPIVMIFWQQAARLGGFPHTTVAALFLSGLFLWTLIEYIFHRFLFHIDDHLPAAGNVVYTGHFILHGIHHFLPMDKERLVMPPALFTILSGAVWQLVSTFVPRPQLHGLFSGGIAGYIVYDLLHYYSHHGIPPWKWLRWLKRYHLEHHYFYPDKGFGVSSPIWDWIFGTAINLSSVK